MPPGAKPKTKHIFVAPLISFYGCVPYPQRSDPCRNIWSNSRPRLWNDRGEKASASCKNQNRTVIGWFEPISLLCSKLCWVTRVKAAPLKLASLSSRILPLPIPTKSVDNTLYTSKSHQPLGRRSDTTLRILSVRGVPPPLYGQNFRQKKVTDLGGTPFPPFTDFSPKIFFKKG